MQNFERISHPFISLLLIHSDNSKLWKKHLYFLSTRQDNIINAETREDFRCLFYSFTIFLRLVTPKLHFSIIKALFVLFLRSSFMLACLCLYFTAPTSYIFELFKKRKLRNCWINLLTFLLLPSSYFLYYPWKYWINFKFYLSCSNSI